MDERIVGRVEKWMKEGWKNEWIDGWREEEGVRMNARGEDRPLLEGSLRSCERDMDLALECFLILQICSLVTHPSIHSFIHHPW